VCVLTFPGEDGYISAQLEDYGAVFGAKVFTNYNFEELKKIGIQDMGSCLKFEVGTFETFFIGKPEKTQEHE
jgi:hypothetical protein